MNWIFLIRELFMNTVLFRAKRTDNGEWIYGFYVEKALQANNIIAEHAIQEAGCYPIEINKSTLGQYREDINAYDGDWIEAETNRYPSEKIVGFLDFQDMECVIEQNDNISPVCSFSVIDRLNIKVTGKNIYDNPELINQ